MTFVERRPLENVRYAMEYSLFALLLVLALAYANGTNDVSKAIATLVGSGITNYRTAILWGTVWTVAGAGLSAFVASAMLKTFSKGLIQAGIEIGRASCRERV